MPTLHTVFVCVLPPPFAEAVQSVLQDQILSVLLHEKGQKSFPWTPKDPFHDQHMI